jgi:hypothetical protein
MEIKSGQDSTALGLSVRIIKSDGTLYIDFNGYDGQYYHWMFYGLKEPGELHQAS